MNIQAKEKANSDPNIAKMLGHVLARQGVFCASLGRYDEARAIKQEGLLIFQDTAIRQSAPLGLNYLGATAWALGEYVEANQPCQESLAITEKLGDRWKQALILEYLGMIAVSLGEYVEAKTIAQRSLVIFREFGYRSGIAFSLNLNGIAARNLGEFEEARRSCQASLTIARFKTRPVVESVSLNDSGLPMPEKPKNLFSAAHSRGKVLLDAVINFDGLCSAKNRGAFELYLLISSLKLLTID